MFVRRLPAAERANPDRVHGEHVVGRQCGGRRDRAFAGFAGVGRYGDAWCAPDPVSAAAAQRP
jgi:hypothetical protein